MAGADRRPRTVRGQRRPGDARRSRSPARTRGGLSIRPGPSHALPRVPPAAGPLARLAGTRGRRPAPAGRGAVPAPGGRGAAAGLVRRGLLLPARGGRHLGRQRRRMLAGRPPAVDPVAGTAARRDVAPPDALVRAHAQHGAADPGGGADGDRRPVRQGPVDGVRPLLRHNPPDRAAPARGRWRRHLPAQPSGLRLPRRRRRPGHRGPVGARRLSTGSTGCWRQGHTRGRRPPRGPAAPDARRPSSGSSPTGSPRGRWPAAWAAPPGRSVSTWSTSTGGSVWAIG